MILWKENDMAWYIDADALNLDIDLYKGATVLDLALAVIKSVKEAPTADVAPRAEVAREIFEEIESLLIRYTFEDNYGDYISTTITDEFAELEKKYTENGLRIKCGEQENQIKGE